MNNEAEVAARSVIVGAIGLSLSLAILLITVFWTHDWPVLAPSIVLTVANLGIILWNVYALRRAA